MSDPQKENEKNPELDCQVTVNDGSYMTCDMIEEESPEDTEIESDYNI